MVITKTPFRISFFGGGTDYPAWAEKNGGLVLSTSINRYCYITCRELPPFFDYNYRIRYTDQEYVKTIAEIKHPSVRECLRFTNTEKKIEMQHNADLPAMSGLGSSSAFTVGFLNALYSLRGSLVAKKQLALDAIHVEQNLIGENVGSQDQVAVAVGGLNRIEFGGPGEIAIAPVTISAEMLKALESRMMLFFTGFSRVASDIAAEQVRGIGQKDQEMRQMKVLVDQATDVLGGNPAHLRDFGKLLDESWQIKRNLSSRITNQHIDDMYAAARLAGATGGKILGAGGGGFMLLFAEPEAKPAIIKKLGSYLHVPFRFENSGSQVIYHNPAEGSYAYES